MPQVAVVPGEAFGAPSCIRISYAASLATLRTALDRLSAALDPAKYRLAGAPEAWDASRLVGAGRG